MKKVYVWGTICGMGLLLWGCAPQQETQVSTEPEVVTTIRSTTEGVGKTVTGAGETGVKTIQAVGEKTGVSPAVRGVSQVIVDASEDIGREQKGKVMGQDVTLFPPETENEGKVIKIEF